MPFIPVVAGAGVENLLGFLSDICLDLGTSSDTTMIFPGIDIETAEIVLDVDHVVNLEFWLVLERDKVNFNEVIEGSDGVIIFVDINAPDKEQQVEAILSSLSCEGKYIPALIMMVDLESEITVYNLEFVESLWGRYVVEIVPINRSTPSFFKVILNDILFSLIRHPNAGFIYHDLSWIRVVYLWRILKRRVNKEVSKDDIIFLGCCFNILYQIAKYNKNFERRMLGTIASRWFEMGGDYLNAYRITEEMGNLEWTRQLKLKYLNHLLGEGSDLLSRKRYKDAALKFEEVAFWNRAALVSYEFEDKIFYKAIEAWLNAFDFRKIPDLLLQIKKPVSFLIEIKHKFLNAIDFLVGQGLYEKADIQTAIAARIYQKHDLHDSASALLRKQVEIKSALLAYKVKNGFVDDALAIIDNLIELEKHLQTKIGISDEILKEICKHLVDETRFKEFEKLLMLIQDQSIRKELHASRTVKEEEIKRIHDEHEQALRMSISARLLVYHSEEREDALRYARERRKMIYKMIAEGNTDRAFYFLKINVQWLRDLDQEVVASELAFQVATEIIRNNDYLKIKELSFLIPKDKFKALIDELIKHLRVLQDLNVDIDLVSLANHYKNQLHSLGYYKQSKIIQGILMKVLLKNIRVRIDSLSDGGIVAVESDLDKIEAMLDQLDNKGQVERELNEIFEKLVHYFANHGDSSRTEFYINKISDLNMKRSLVSLLTRRQKELEKQKPKHHELKEQRRRLREDLQDTKRILLLNKGDLEKRRKERFKFIRDLVTKGKLPSPLLATVTNDNIVINRLEVLKMNQSRALDYFIDERVHEEAARTLLVLALISLKLEDGRGIPKILQDFKSRNLITESKITSTPAYDLFRILVSCIEITDIDLHSDILTCIKLLPLINGEAALNYMISGETVPQDVIFKGAQALEDDFVSKIKEILPYLFEMTTTQFDHLKETLLLKRQILLKKGEIQALSYLERGDFEQAALLYQHDAFKHLDSGEHDLGWTSVWLSILSHVRGGIKINDIINIFNKILKSCEKDKGFFEHPMKSLVQIFLRCIEKKMKETLLEFQTINENLPLLNNELEILDLGKLPRIKKNQNMI
ncbi:MAG: hypothetical protein ACTSRA_13895 [Promethearchaeota archaeon]